MSFSTNSLKPLQEKTNLMATSEGKESTEKNYNFPNGYFKHVISFSTDGSVSTSYYIVL